MGATGQQELGLGLAPPAGAGHAWLHWFQMRLQRPLRPRPRSARADVNLRSAPHVPPARLEQFERFSQGPRGAQCFYTGAGRMIASIASEISASDAPHDLVRAQPDGIGSGHGGPAGSKLAATAQWGPLHQTRFARALCLLVSAR